MSGEQDELLNQEYEASDALLFKMGCKQEEKMFLVQLEQKTLLTNGC